MPFHLGTHKPISVKRASFALRHRFLLVLFAAMFLALGGLRLSRGTLFAPNWHFQVDFSGAWIATGVMLLVLSFVPLSWIEKAAYRLVSSGHRRGKRLP